MTVDAKGRTLRVGDVVQIAPSQAEKGGFFAGCFMQVTEVKAFGAQGFIAIPGSRGEVPGQAFFRCKSEDMVWVGPAEWVPDGEEGDA